MSVVCLGEILIDFVALETGVTVGEASGFEKKPGGAPANVAVAVKRLGNDAAFLGMVGPDPFGEYLRGVLKDEGVNVDGLKTTDQANTMLAFVSLRADGERSFSFYRNPSADMLMTTNDIAFEVIDAHKIFHFGSITMISEPSASATLAAADYATKKGKLVSYDPNLRLALWESEDAAKKGMLRGFEVAHIVKVSEEELDFLTGNGNVMDLWRNQTKLIVVTHGASGATAYLKEGKMHVPGKAVKAVDTTGAGDSFVAGILDGILDHNLDEALWTDINKWGEIINFANSVAALSTTQRGAIPSLPDKDSAKGISISIG